MFSGIKFSYCIIALLGSAVQAFGLYNIHSLSGVTEGGVLGMTLLLDHWLQISPAVSGFVMNGACYALGWKLLGRVFLVYSFVASAGFSVAYRICEQFDPLWPKIAQMPLLAAVLGAAFVGVGAGICVRVGGATSGDDALAMSLSHVTRVKVQWIYLTSDLIVLLLSLSYIPVKRIAYSLLTVILSGQIIGAVQKIPSRRGRTQK
ncbi:MAG: YitT family protein [Lachnospiraceae bacterium]|uniref:YitT family protein n=1 Tax=Parablautia sp. Marseille-Q6255 TaxID=3039593 RepID=UPI0024BCFF18|nr:YitT family protein [Parablautia sp. Marseille-Q6255]